METEYTRRNIANFSSDGNKVLEDVDPANSNFINSILHDIDNARNDLIGESENENSLSSNSFTKHKVLTRTQQIHLIFT